MPNRVTSITEIENELTIRHFHPEEPRGSYRQPFRYLFNVNGYFSIVNSLAASLSHTNYRPVNPVLANKSSITVAKRSAYQIPG